MLIRSLTAAIFALLLASCGGGGGGDSALRIQFSTTTVKFSAATAWSLTPAEQEITGTLSGEASGTLYIAVEVNNPEIALVSTPSIVPGSHGRATVIPVSPADLGAGTHSGTFIVKACLNDPTCQTGHISGSPRTINVHYEIGDSVVADTVSPPLVESGSTGPLILRGHGFTPATTVHFGATPASAVTFVSNTELRVTHPPLSVGSHDVLLGGGSTPFDGTLTVVDSPAFSADFLPHPFSPPAFVTSLVYDAKRQALLMTVTTGVPNPVRLMRYEYNGTEWASPTIVDFPELRLLGMSHDESHVLGAVRTGEFSGGTLVEIDPVTLSALASTTISAGHRISGAALTNHGHVMLMLQNFSGYVEPVMFNTADRTFETMWSAPARGYPIIASGDRSKIVVGNPAGAIPARYEASTSVWVPVAGEVTTGTDALPSADVAGTRFQSGVGVYDDDLQTIGVALNGVGVMNVAAVINRDGTRLYVYASTGVLRTFDLTVPAIQQESYLALVEMGSPVPLATSPGGESYPPPQMAITPDGRTVFIAGTEGVAIEPTPQ